MATLADIRTGLADALAAIPGVQSSPYPLSAPTPPCFFVQPAEVNYDETLGRGYDRWLFTITGLVSAGSGDIGAHMNLDRWLAPSGAESVKAALETDATLGGHVEDLRVLTASGYRVFQREGGGIALGCEWSVLLFARGEA
jgi:hypothetical protein